MIAMNDTRKAALPSVSSLLVILLASCTVGPNFVRPSPEVAPHWSKRSTAPPVAEYQQSSSPTAIPMSTVTERSVDLRAWWSTFDDPMLTSLIERAANANLDLRTAMLRIDEARHPNRY
jgi:outer membrane protein TolC